MNVAVVASTVEVATETVARLGMTGKATPLRWESSPLLGHRFTAVLVVTKPTPRVRDQAWWSELNARTSGPFYTLDPWGEVAP